MLAVVTRPRAASALAGLVVAVAAASVLLSAAWLGLPAAGAALAALALLVGLLHSLRGGLSPVSALRASLRAAAGNCGYRRVGATPACCVGAGAGVAYAHPAALALREYGLYSQQLHLYRLAAGLRPDAWRRLCLLLAQAEPRAAAPAAPREAQ